MGGDFAPHVMVKSIGTSTCDVVIGEKGAKEEVVQGICGQVDGSVVSGYIGYEAGQSAYGDYYAWFRNVVLWPTEHLVGHDEVLEKKVLMELESAAQKLPLTENDPVALDWINGRRTPDANQNLTAYMEGITLGTDAPSLMKMLLESTAFGARAIIECYERGHVSIDKIVAIGGVARKSFFGMQILADVTGREIQVTAGDQSCAIGSAVFAATAAGLYPDLFSAQRALSAGIERIHKPIAEHQRIYEILYKKYQQLGHFAESQVQKM
jgi:L-ribulokinase